MSKRRMNNQDLQNELTYKENRAISLLEQLDGQELLVNMIIRLGATARKLVDLRIRCAQDKGSKESLQDQIPLLAKNFAELRMKILVGINKLDESSIKAALEKLVEEMEAMIDGVRRKIEEKLEEHLARKTQAEGMTLSEQKANDKSEDTVTRPHPTTSAVNEDTNPQAQTMSGDTAPERVTGIRLYPPVPERLGAKQRRKRIASFGSSILGDRK